MAGWHCPWGWTPARPLQRQRRCSLGEAKWLFHTWRVVHCGKLSEIFVGSPLDESDEIFQSHVGSNKHQWGKSLKYFNNFKKCFFTVNESQSAIDWGLTRTKCVHLSTFRELFGNGALGHSSQWQWSMTAGMQKLFFFVPSQQCQQF